MTRGQLFLILAGLFFESSAVADLHGRVVGISDADTFTVLTQEKQQVKVRLAEIDAPEAGQPYETKSKQALSDLVFGKNVRVELQTTDRYGRAVGRPYVGDLDVCEEMVRIGAAWAYREYLRDKNLVLVEQDARNGNRGVWGLSEAQNMPPWEWRQTGNENPDGDCQIKGNINAQGERIYHLPGSTTYGATRINEARGEKWFCSQIDAKRSGWRPARSGKPARSAQER